ncbi:pentapeptide repeat-containing protein [Amycolatopsis sp. NPDC051102]|uniref:pentapeptide repeat-containing protein n=1 Tax=Amycolatopsis sp. NPDC051102 TaxID=3155163 RepID=UPI0034362609
MATVATGLAAVGALYFTNQSLQSTQRQIAQNGQQIGLSEQSQYTERFGKAVEQIGSDKLDVRLGGIYALERLADDSSRDRSTIAQVISAFVRTHSTCMERPSQPPPDVAAGLGILSTLRRVVPGRTDLRKLCLSQTDLKGYKFANFDLTGADLRGCHLGSVGDAESVADTEFEDANLAGATIEGVWRNVHAVGANLQHAQLALSLHNTEFILSNLDFARVSLLKGLSPASPAEPAAVFLHASLRDARFGGYAEGIDFSEADLTRTDFSFADLSGAQFSTGAWRTTMAGTKFVHAGLRGADLEGLDLRSVDFTGTDLSGANLRGADLRGAITVGALFDGADLTGARR